MRITVYHDGYGCETGCCGHWVEIEGGRTAFEFEHNDDGESPIEFAKRLVLEAFGADHVADLDWDECVISDGRGC